MDWPNRPELRNRCSFVTGVGSSFGDSPAGGICHLSKACSVSQLVLTSRCRLASPMANFLVRKGPL